MSYYKKIEGVRYDRALLEAAQEAVSGRGDGRVSRADAETLLSLVTDGGRYTAAEEATVAWAKANLKWTDKARGWFDEALKDWQAAPPPPEPTPTPEAFPTPAAAPEAPKPTAPDEPGRALIFRIAPGNRFSKFFSSISAARAEGCGVVLLSTNDGDVPLDPIWARTSPHKAADLPGNIETALCEGILELARLRISSIYRIFGAADDGQMRYKAAFTNVPVNVLAHALKAEGFLVFDAASRL